MAKSQWYVNRLRAMSTEEIWSRFEMSLKKRNWKKRAEWQVPAPDFSKLPDIYRPTASAEAGGEVKEIVKEADRYVKGDYTLLNYSYSEPVIDWHLDPQSGKRAPLRFGLDLNYRDPELVGNVKNIWEKNRHHHLTVLALAYYLTGKEGYAQAVESQLNSWVEQNPFPLGVNWTSSLELGVRLISWVWIYRLLRGTPAHERLFGVHGRLWPSIYWHQWLISQHRSHGSSANNHLLGEMAGLCLASLEWPVYDESDEWRKTSLGILEEEIGKQTFENGLNKEQAASYHFFSLEFFLLAYLEAVRYNVHVALSYKDWLVRMVEIVPILTDVGGNFPRFGDEDQGMALQLRPLSSSRTDWLLKIGRELGARVPLTESTDGNVAFTLITGKSPPKASPDAESLVPECSLGLHESGHYLLISNRHKPNELFCLADAGPLGFLSIAAHGHADALSFTLHIGGMPVIVDPGTYTYHADPKFRSYFRGTKAHNTIEIDGKDQSQSCGPFLWIQKAETKVLTWEASPDRARLIAEHDGYTRLPGRVVHRRELQLAENRLHVLDQVSGSGEHALEWRLHFHPDVQVQLSQGICTATWRKGCLRMGLDKQLSWRLMRGEEGGGWYSRGFNLLEQTTTLAGAVKANLPLRIEHILEVMS